MFFFYTLLLQNVFYNAQTRPCFLSFFVSFFLSFYLSFFHFSFFFIVNEITASVNSLLHSSICNDATTDLKKIILLFCLFHLSINNERGYLQCSSHIKVFIYTPVSPFLTLLMHCFSDDCTHCFLCLKAISRAKKERKKFQMFCIVGFYTHSPT